MEETNTSCLNISSEITESETNQSMVSNSIKSEFIRILDSIFSFQNLSNDIFIRSYLEEDGYIKFKFLLLRKDLKNLLKNLTKRQIFDLLNGKMNFENCEILYIQKQKEEYKVRNKNWNSIKNRLFGVNEIVTLKNFNNYNFDLLCENIDFYRDPSLNN